jgi:hypothetical protein
MPTKAVIKILKKIFILNNTINNNTINSNTINNSIDQLCGEKK